MIAARTEAELNAVLLQRMDLTAGLAVFRAAPIDGEMPAFKPGQFAVLGLPHTAPRCNLAEQEDQVALKSGLIKRAYSIASPADEDRYLEFYITLVASGLLTPRLFALKQGDRLWLGPKISGMFTLDKVPDDQNIVLIATGTGLAPYMSMLRSVATPYESRRVTVLHGARHSWELGYRDELITIERFCPNFTYIPSITRPDEELVRWEGRTGRLQQIWQQDLLRPVWGSSPSPDNTHIFLCGNPAMISAMLELLVQQEFKEHTRRQPGQIHYEKYW